MTLDLRLVPASPLDTVRSAVSLPESTTAAQRAFRSAWRGGRAGG
jgi:hypothetical protein